MDAKAKAEAERETERLTKAEAPEPERLATVNTPTPLMAVHVLIAHLRRYGISELPHADLLELFNTLDQAFEAAKTNTKEHQQPKRKRRRDVDDFLADKRAKEQAATAETPAAETLTEVAHDVARSLGLANAPKAKAKPKAKPKAKSKTKRR
jgi:hypothetical protein